MRDRLILDLCGGTGSWSRPYVEADYDVRLIDIKNGDDVRLFKPPSEPVWGILAAPPCVEFSYAKHFHGKGNYSHDFLRGLSIVDACLRIVTVTEPVWWALENPKSYLLKWLGKPIFQFQPWWYGDDYQKQTCLWGKFSEPKRSVFEKPAGLKKFSMLKSKEIHPDYYGKLSRQERRAITPRGFAQSFFEANQ